MNISLFRLCFLFAILLVVFKDVAGVRVIYQRKSTGSGERDVKKGNILDAPTKKCKNHPMEQRDSKDRCRKVYGKK